MSPTSRPVETAAAEEPLQAGGLYDMTPAEEEPSEFEQRERAREVPYEVIVGFGGTGLRTIAALATYLEQHGISFTDEIRAIFVDVDVKETGSVNDSGGQRRQEYLREKRKLIRELEGKGVIVVNTFGADSLATLDAHGLTDEMTKPSIPDGLSAEGAQGDSRIGHLHYTARRIVGKEGDPVKALSSIVKKWNEGGQDRFVAKQVRLSVVGSMHGGTGPSSQNFIVEAKAAMKELLGPEVTVVAEKYSMNAEPADFDDEFEGTDRKRRFRLNCAAAYAYEYGIDSQCGFRINPKGKWVSERPDFHTVVGGQTLQALHVPGKGGHTIPTQIIAYHIGHRLTQGGIIDRYRNNEQPERDDDAPKGDKASVTTNRNIFSVIGAASLVPDRDPITIAKKRKAERDAQEAWGNTRKQAEEAYEEATKAIESQKGADREERERIQEETGRRVTEILDQAAAKATELGLKIGDVDEARLAQMVSELFPEDFIASLAEMVEHPPVPELGEFGTGQDAVASVVRIVEDYKTRMEKGMKEATIRAIGQGKLPEMRQGLSERYQTSLTSEGLQGGLRFLEMMEQALTNLMDKVEQEKMRVDEAELGRHLKDVDARKNEIARFRFPTEGMFTVLAKRALGATGSKAITEATAEMERKLTGLCTACREYGMRSAQFTCARAIPKLIIDQLQRTIRDLKVGLEAQLAAAQAEVSDIKDTAPEVPPDFDETPYDKVLAAQVQEKDTKLQVADKTKDEELSRVAAIDEKFAGFTGGFDVPFTVTDEMVRDDGSLDLAVLRAQVDIREKLDALFRNSVPLMRPTNKTQALDLGEKPTIPVITIPVESDREADASPISIKGVKPVAVGRLGGVAVLQSINKIDPLKHDAFARNCFTECLEVPATYELAREAAELGIPGVTVEETLEGVFTYKGHARRYLFPQLQRLAGIQMAEAKGQGKILTCKEKTCRKPFFVLRVDLETVGAKGCCPFCTKLTETRAMREGGEEPKKTERAPAPAARSAPKKR